MSPVEQDKYHSGIPRLFIYGIISKQEETRNYIKELLAVHFLLSVFCVFVARGVFVQVIYKMLQKSGSRNVFTPERRYTKADSRS